VKKAGYEYPAFFYRFNMQSDEVTAN